MNSDAYWEGYSAASRGESREPLNPWNVAWLRDWLRGYDDYVTRDAIDGYELKAIKDWPLDKDIPW